MNTYPKKAAVGIALCALLTTLPLLAQDTMPGMDMSSPQSTPPKTAKPAAGHAQPAKKVSARKPAQNADAMPGMDRTPMPQTTGVAQRLDAGQQTGVRPVVRGLGAPVMDMQGIDMSSMQGGSAPANARSADYSDGIGYGSMIGMDMHDNAARGMLLLDQLEYFNGRDADGVALDAQAWYGNDRNKLWLKADGEHSGGRLQELRTEALWNRSLATYWDTQLGVRRDFGSGPGRNWAAFGVQGLAPYWFDIEATGYVGSSGRTAARFEAEYDLRLTQRLIFQPDLELNFYGRDDKQRGIGSGLSDLELGLRLRYEFSRQFAPYVGIDLKRRFGRTADFVRAEGEHAYDPQLVAGVRLWF